MIKNYTDFINENIGFNDIFKILDIIMNKPMKDIIELRDSIKDLSLTTESINEGLFDNLKFKFKRKFDDIIWKYLINRKRDFYNQLVNKLNIFDLTTIDDVKGFQTIESIYLAGGMDKSKDTGAGWRNILEYEFEKYGDIVDTTLPKVDLGPFGKIQPKHIVDGIFLEKFIKNTSKTKKLYDFPLTLNPVRKEVDRTKNAAFAAAATKYKTFTNITKPNEYEPTLSDIKNTMNKNIEVDDEHLVRLTDAIFLGLNQAAAAGTYGELQTQSFLNKPIFVWMTDKEWKLGTTKDDPYGGFSMWSFPHFSKLARNEEEMKILVETIYSSI